MATTEGYKDRATLLRLLINYCIRGSGNTQMHTLHKTKKKKGKGYSRKRKLIMSVFNNGKLEKV